MRQDSQINTANDRMLRDDQYALIVMDKRASQHKLFPTNTKDSTMESCVEFNNYCNDLGPGEQQKAAHFLKKACKTWGLAVPPVVEDYAPSKAEVGYSNMHQAEVPLAPLHKQASPQYQHFALERVGRFAIDTPELVKAASSYFDKHWGEFTPSDRRDFARAVGHRADTLGVPVGDHINKFASDSYNPNLPGELSLRRSNVRDEQMKSAYTKLWGHKGDLNVDQFADLLGKLDKKAGIDRFYNQGLISDALTATVGVEVQKQSNMIELGGIGYGAPDIVRALSNMSAKEPALFGEDMVSQLKKNPELFTSLPMPEQEIILSYAD